MIEAPGFADPVRDAQRSFRAILDAMARPGRVHEAGAGLRPPAPLDAATAAVLLTLVDGETPLWIAPGMWEAREWLTFHCGARVVAEQEGAAFVVTGELPDLGALRVGTDEEPELSATVVLQVAALGHGRRFRLKGPGLERPAVFKVEGLPDGFAGIWARNRRWFPLGVDLILCAGDRVAALPRSVRVEEG